MHERAKAVAFFFEHAGLSYYPAKETEADGKERYARELAKAEAWLKEQGGSADWAVDEYADRSGINHNAPLYEVCVSVPCFNGVVKLGQRQQFLGGVDLGPGGVDDAYRRLVAAELAFWLMS